MKVGGIVKTSYTFSDTAVDGRVGLATWNANSRFDDFGVQDYLPPPPPPSASLPVQEDFEDGLADFFNPITGSWSTSNGRYHATPGADAIAVLRVNEALPVDLEIAATMNSEPAAGGFYSNAYVVFDYQSPTDFKFAGASIGSGKWAIGRRSGNSWITDAFGTASISANTDYDVKLQIENDETATLLVNDLPQASHTFSDSLTDGDVGLATWKAKSQFDDFSVAAFVPPPPPPAATLPMWEDFNDGVADYFGARSESGILRQTDTAPRRVATLSRRCGRCKLCRQTSTFKPSSIPLPYQEVSTAMVTWCSTTKDQPTSSLLGRRWVGASGRLAGAVAPNGSRINPLTRQSTHRPITHYGLSSETIIR